MSTLVEKHKFPRAVALGVARELCNILRPACDQLIVAGSLRRRKTEVGDVEIVYVPSRVMVPDPADLFGKMIEANAVDLLLGVLATEGVIERRLNVKGSTMWGEWNKFARHLATGVPVDFFAATARNWGNYLVCRTGGAEMNKAICNAAIDRGWHWNPYGAGFKREGSEQVYECATEEEVFQFAGLPFLQPWERK